MQLPCDLLSFVRVRVSLLYTALDAGCCGQSVTRWFPRRRVIPRPAIADARISLSPKGIQLVSKGFRRCKCNPNARRFAQVACGLRFSARSDTYRVLIFLLGGRGI